MDWKKRISLLLSLLLLLSLVPTPVFAAGLAGIYSDRVSVSFVGVQAELLQYVVVLNEQGEAVSPVPNAVGGGSCELAPGQYAYGFHDPEGRYEDLVPALLTLDETMEEVVVTLSLIPAGGTEQSAPVSDTVQGELLPVLDTAAGELTAVLPASDAALEELTAAPVPVFFRSDETDDFSRLTVYDSVGNSVEPLFDSLTGRILYDSYLLSPGPYSYRFQDAGGLYGSLSAGFTVVGPDAQYIHLKLGSSMSGQGFSRAFLNPVYAGFISEAELPAPAMTGEQSLLRLQQIVEILSGASSGIYAQNTVYSAADTTVCQSVSAAGAALRADLVRREPEIAVLYGCSEAPSEETWRRLCTEIFDNAVVHNGVPAEGDYLRCGYSGFSCSGAATGTVLPGVYVYEFLYYPDYLTNAAQEAELAGVTAGILSGLQLGSKNSGQKLDAIYSYLCQNVSHDSGAFTAYDALVSGRASGLGVAAACYRLCLEAGVDARIVTDAASRHAWNIASPDGARYFALDAAWDAGTAPENRQFFLKGRTSWLTTHSLGDQFADGSYAAYDFPAADYGMKQASPETEAEAVIQSVSLLFDGMLRIKYYFSFSDRLKNDPGATICFRKSGVEVMRVPLSNAKEEDGRSCFYFSLNASEIADPVQVLIYDGYGQSAEIRSRSDTPYPNGFFFSAMEYASQMRQSGSSESMRALAAALEEYGTAAQIYFQGSASRPLNSAVRSVQASDLAQWEITTDGIKPAGLVKASVSVMFEADNSLRLYFTFNGSVNPYAFSYEIDGNWVSLSQRSDGAYYISISNISADQLDTAHRFSITDGLNTYTVTASVLGYAKTAIERGSYEAADLGRTLYFYNRAAKAYFG